MLLQQLAVWSQRTLSAAATATAATTTGSTTCNIVKHHYYEYSFRNKFAAVAPVFINLLIGGFAASQTRYVSYL
eukprot:18422-Heterococcus_DN1.PRE.5